jgi:hypothetical protein
MSADEQPVDPTIAQLRLDAAALRRRAARRLAGGDVQAAADLHARALELEILADRQGCQDPL